jgi:hypothetical protein
MVTLGMGRDKGRGLLFHEALLERREDLLRFREGQAEVLNTLASLIHDHYIGEGFFVAIIVTHHELDCNLHGSCPPVWVTPVGWLILCQTDGLPPAF